MQTEGCVSEDSKKNRPVAILVAPSGRNGDGGREGRRAGGRLRENHAIAFLIICQSTFSRHVSTRSTHPTLRLTTCQLVCSTVLFYAITVTTQTHWDCTQKALVASARCFWWRFLLSSLRNPKIFCLPVYDRFYNLFTRS